MFSLDETKTFQTYMYNQGVRVLLDGMNAHIKCRIELKYSNMHVFLKIENIHNDVNIMNSSPITATIPTIFTGKHVKDLEFS